MFVVCLEYRYHLLWNQLTIKNRIFFLKILVYLLFSSVVLINPSFVSLCNESQVDKFCWLVFGIKRKMLRHFLFLKFLTVISVAPGRFFYVRHDSYWIIIIIILFVKSIRNILVFTQRRRRCLWQMTFYRIFIFIVR